MDPFLSLRQLLEGPPSPTLFRFILEAFAYWNDEDSLPTALDFAEQHLGEWDDSLRHAKLRELYEEGQLHPASRLVRSLCLHADLSEDTWHTLLSSGAFDHITHLSFSHYLDASWKTLSPWLHRIQTQLKGLSLDQCPPPIAQELPTHLADLPALQSLTLTYKSDASLAFLSRPLPSLRHLNTSKSSSYLEEGYLLNVPSLSQLESISFQYRLECFGAFFDLTEALSSKLTSLSLNCPGGDEDGAAFVEKLTEAFHPAQLRQLSIGNGSIKDYGVALLAAHPAFSGLTDLFLRDSHLGGSALRVLGLSSTLKELKCFSYEGFNVREDDVLNLLRSALAKNLSSLTLSNIEWTESCTNTFLNLSILPQLTSFGLPSVHDKLSELLQRLAYSPKLQQLRALSLDGTHCSPESLLALVDSPNAQRLTQLTLNAVHPWNTERTVATLDALVRAPRLPIGQRKDYLYEKDSLSGNDKLEHLFYLRQPLQDAAKAAGRADWESCPLHHLLVYLPDIARPLGEREERTTTPQERLEGYLKQPPSRELFGAIIELLSAWPARQEPEKALAKAKEAMAEWSDDCCYASLSEIWPGVPQTEPPAVFSLVRTLFVPGGLMADELFQPFLKQLTAPHIKHITCERPTFSSQSLQILARTSALSGLLSVKLPAAALDPFSGIALARSPHLQQVTHWHWHNLQDDQELLALIKTGLIKKATTLSLSFARLSEASLQPLRELQESGKLDTLDLYATSPTQLDAFVKSALFASVREVRLTDTKFPEDLSAHFAADDWAHVTSLVFTRVDDCDRILSHWAQETAPLSLQSLEVESCLTEEGLEALTQSAQYSALQTLKLERCYKLPTGAQETLFRSTQLASLETLCIDSTGSWGWSFVRSIKDTEPRGLPKLKHLFIITNHMDDAELKLLIQHYGVDLETLELSRCNLRSKVFKELAKSSHLPHLQALILRGNESTKTGIKMLSQSTHSLCHLECVGNPGYTEGLPDLVASVRLSQEAKRSALSSAFHTDLIELARHFQLPAPESYHKQELLAFLSTQSGPPKTSQEAKEPLSQEEAALLQKTKKELMKLAKIHLIPRRSSMSKQELAHALSQKMNPL